VLPNRVDLVDRRARRREQRRRERAEIADRDGVRGRASSARCPAGDDRENEVVGAGALGRVEDPPSALDTPRSLGSG